MHCTYVRHLFEESTFDLFLLISFQNLFPKYKLPNSGHGLSVGAAYMPVFTDENYFLKI